MDKESLGRVWAEAVDKHLRIEYDPKGKSEFLRAECVPLDTPNKPSEPEQFNRLYAEMVAMSCEQEEDKTG